MAAIAARDLIFLLGRLNDCVSCGVRVVRACVDDFENADSSRNEQHAIKHAAQIALSSYRDRAHSGNYGRGTPSCLGDAEVSPDLRDP